MPSIHGRWPAGTSANATVHDRDDTTATTARTDVRTTRRPEAEPSQVPSSRAGRTNHACSIFAWKPTPTARPAATRGHHLPVSTERCQQQSATARAAVTIASSIGCANIDTNTGVVAAAAAATRPVPGPAQRSPTSEHAQMVTSPSTTWGSASAAVESPSSRRLRACGTAKPLSLSSVTVAPGSKAPEASAAQDSDIDRAAAW